MSTSSIFIDGYDVLNPEHVKKYREDLYPADQNSK